MSRKKGSGGQREGAGRKVIPGMVKVGYKLPLATVNLLRKCSRESGETQSAIVDSALKFLLKYSTRSSQ